MRVRDCKNCPYLGERRWAQYYEPKNYHPIGFCHVYAVCKLTNKRCTEVRKSECARGRKQA